MARKRSCCFCSEASSCRISGESDGGYDYAGDGVGGYDGDGNGDAVMVAMIKMTVIKIVALTFLFSDNVCGKVHEHVRPSRGRRHGAGDHDYDHNDD